MRRRCGRMVGTDLRRLVVRQRACRRPTSHFVGKKDRKRRIKVRRGGKSPIRWEVAEERLALSPRCSRNKCEQHGGKECVTLEASITFIERDGGTRAGSRQNKDSKDSNYGSRLLEV
ncbi:hypothetical protein DdX_09459 [Ditylenchus destructor]|uniref:Uncharacterized protein n=1 Tax=Ditylenchus destructor TaxID=166010 RepID=A0AAD4R6J4_9BILA|nr:hypothetical protein DdX_09459 [Ditylenchus destructor]